MKPLLLTVLLLACASLSTNAQSCLSQDDVRQMLARVEAPAPVKPNKKLKEELLKLANKQRELLLQVVSNDEAKASDQQKLHKVFQSHTVKLCEMLKTSGWPTTALVDREGVVSTSPIKGTRARGASPAEDRQLREELQTSVKERAENVMIVDLMRNDLSRICEIGTVAVTRLFEVESHPQVHQLVSTVEGRMRGGLDAIDAIAACFPAGSMTGAPKKRAMELLDGIECGPRGLYAGAFGYLGIDGTTNMSMTIRTAVCRGDAVEIGTGGGITALSVAEEEVEEIHLKARALLRAMLPSEQSTVRQFPDVAATA